MLDQGAVECLFEPLSHTALLKALTAASRVSEEVYTIAASAPGLSKLSPKSHATPIVFIVDDDISVRGSLELLIRSEGWQPEAFESAQVFLARPGVLVPSCLVLDVSLPALNGRELQKRVAVDRDDMPIIFITGYRDVPMAVQAMKAGAAEFLTKPFDDDVLLKAVRHAHERSQTAAANGRLWRWWSPACCTNKLVGSSALARSPGRHPGAR